MSGRQWLACQQPVSPAEPLCCLKEEEEEEKRSSGELGGWVPRPRAAQARRAAIRLLEGLLAVQCKYTGLVQRLMEALYGTASSVWHTAKLLSAPE